MKLLQETVRHIAPPSPEHREAARKHILKLTMPRWALGRLLDLAVDLAGMTRDLSLPVARKKITVIAGDHGIVADGVSAQPSAITGQMVGNFIAGGAGINVLARLAGAEVVVIDMGVIADLSVLVRDGQVRDCRIAPGTASFVHGPAMSREQAVEALEHGIRIATELACETDVFGTGEMGIGNTSPSTAIITVLSGSADPAPFVGAGAGLPAEKLAHKSSMIRRGIEINRPDPADGIDVLAKVGGFEIGGIAGVILGAARCHKPVVVDGFISSAGALIAAAIEPKTRDYLILGHGSAEPGHAAMAKLLGKKPLLDLEMRLGEGTGAATAMHLLDAASAIMREMATFESAGVEEHGL